MIQEFDAVALTRDIESVHLKKGDLGTVVDIIADGKAYIVEFLLPGGFTAALETFEAGYVRPLKDGELEQRKYREWKPEWTGGFGYAPPLSELADGDRFPSGQCPDAHYLAYVDGAEVRAD